MKISRVMIAAPKSGSGKTMITCALLQALKNRGQKVVSYKCGPDYIDPMFHEKVIGIPSRNLDTFFTDEKMTRALFLSDRTEEEIAVLEGVMGMYDGLGGIGEEGSSYHLAKVTNTPIVLVVDAKGMGRSVVALIAGFLAYDKEQLIKGVILNRMSKSYYEIIKPLIEEELNIRVFGYFPEQKELRIESRHLGLVLPDEVRQIQNQLEKVSKEFAQTVSVDDIIQVADASEVFDDDIILTANASELFKNNMQIQYGLFADDRQTEKKNDTKAYIIQEKKPVIAVAKDAAFCFYYAENLRMLQDFGVDIQYFSPLQDEKLPEGCSALLLGGGYPELYAERLSGNQRIREILKESVEAGMPIVAECGGFMYLHDTIIAQDEKSYPMTGVLSATCYNTGKLVRFGYVELREYHSNFLPEGECIRGHEFHYFDSEENGTDCVATKPVTGRTYPCIITSENCWMGFPHLYYPSNPHFAKAFVQKAGKYMKKG